MKRTVSVFLAICLAFCLLPAAAFAESTSYYLDEVQMSIDLPSELVVFTRDTDDSVYRQYGVSKEQISTILYDNSAYLLATGYVPEANYALHVFMFKQNVVEDLNRVSPETHSMIMSSIENEFKELGASNVRYEDYQGSKANYIKIYFTIPVNGLMCDKLRYVTMKNGKTIAIEIMSASGELTPEHEKLLQEVVESARFDTGSQSIAKGDDKVVKTDGGSQVHWVQLGVGAAIIVLVLIFALRKKGVRKKETPAEPTVPEPTPEASEENPQQQCYCRNCGAAMPEDSNFCPKCGTPRRRDNSQ